MTVVAWPAALSTEQDKTIAAAAGVGALQLQGAACIAESAGPGKWPGETQGRDVGALPLKGANCIRSQCMW
jgi:hypothetical protein